MCDNDESNLTALINRQLQLNKDIDTHKIFLYTYMISCNSVLIPPNIAGGTAKFLFSIPVFNFTSVENQ